MSKKFETGQKVTCRANQKTLQGEFVYEVANFDDYLSRFEGGCTKCLTMCSRVFKLDWMEGYFEIITEAGYVYVKFIFKPLDKGCMSWMNHCAISILEDSKKLFNVTDTWIHIKHKASVEEAGFLRSKSMYFTKNKFLGAAKAGCGSTLSIVLECHAILYMQLYPEYTHKPIPAKISRQPEINGALRRGAEADFTIACGGREYPVQRAVMKWASPVFRRMIESGMLETSSQRVVIEDVDPKILEMMLDFVYKGRIEGLSGTTIVDLLYCAEKYELLDLKSRCLDYLVTTVSDENFTQFLSSAITCNAGEQTITKLMDHCKKRCWQLLQRDEFRAYVEANPEVFNGGKKTDQK